MAPHTSPDVSSLVLYQCFPRNHGAHGTLADVTADLPRIRRLGVDVLYLMPIHPIGEQGRKGSLGSPYAISDYRRLDPTLGTEEDFAALLEAAHGLGMRVIIDVVFNHTAQDSVLVSEHPEFFHTDAAGRPVSSVPEWSDIIDLKHPDPALSRYLIDSLAGWVDRGVDGFRCDVASLVPVEFWIQAREELSRSRPDLLWLAETPHPKWVKERRENGNPTWSDAEMFAAFDMEYQYDLWSIWQAVLRHGQPPARFLEMVRWEGTSLPENAAKLRFAENHDNYRIMTYAPTRDSALAWTALMATLPGPFMVYAGQESAATEWPSLFEPAPIEWGDYELSDFLRGLSAVVHHPAQRHGAFRVAVTDPVVCLAWTTAADSGVPGLVGVFTVAGHSGDVSVPLPDGEYSDVISGATIPVQDGRIPAPAAAVVLQTPAGLFVEHEHSPLLDVFDHVETAEE